MSISDGFLTSTWKMRSNYVLLMNNYILISIPDLKWLNICFSSCCWLSRLHWFAQRTSLLATDSIVGYYYYTILKLINKQYLFGCSAYHFYGDKVPHRILNTNSRRVQHRIVMLHNYFRTSVRPSASNMLAMVSLRQNINNILDLKI